MCTHSSQTASLNICSCWSGFLLTMFSWPGLPHYLISFYKNSLSPSMPFQNASFPWRLSFIPSSGSLFSLCKESSSVTFIFKSSYLCIYLLLPNCRCHWPFASLCLLEHSPMQINAHGIYWAWTVKWFQLICSELIWTLPGETVTSFSKVTPYSTLKL